MKYGNLRVLTRTTGFKLAYVVGYPREGRTRVVLWRAASGRWTLPQTYDSEHIRHLNDEELQKHRNTIRQAWEALKSTQWGVI